MTKEPDTDYKSDQRAAINQNFQFFGWGAKNYNHLNETGTKKTLLKIHVLTPQAQSSEFNIIRKLKNVP